jgi:hypothetical protein
MRHRPGVLASRRHRHQALPEGSLELIGAYRRPGRPDRRSDGGWRRRPLLPPGARTVEAALGPWVWVPRCQRALAGPGDRAGGTAAGHAGAPRSRAVRAQGRRRATATRSCGCRSGGRTWASTRACRSGPLRLARARPLARASASRSWLRRWNGGAFSGENARSTASTLDTASCGRLALECGLRGSAIVLGTDIPFTAGRRARPTWVRPSRTRCAPIPQAVRPDGAMSPRPDLHGFFLSVGRPRPRSGQARRWPTMASAAVAAPGPAQRRASHKNLPRSPPGRVADLRGHAGHRAATRPGGAVRVVDGALNRLCG